MLPYEDMDDPLHKDDLAVILDCPWVSKKKKLHRNNSGFL